MNLSWDKVLDTCQLYGHDGLVVIWKLVVQSHDNTVGHDGDDDDPLEGRPVDQPGHQLPHRAGRGEQEQGGGPAIVWFILFLFAHLDQFLGALTTNHQHKTTKLAIQRKSSDDQNKNASNIFRNIDCGGYYIDGYPMSKLISRLKFVRASPFWKFCDFDRAQIIH